MSERHAIWALLLLAPLLLGLAAAAPESTLMLAPLVVVVGAAMLGWQAPSFCLYVLVALLALSPERHITAVPAATTLALHKMGILMCCVVIALRFGVARQFNGPALAYTFMFVVGLTGGNLHPELGLAGSVRSLLGLLAQFAFISVRLERAWLDRYVLLIALIPAISLFFGIPAFLVGFDAELFTLDNGTYRLESLNHAAFLAYFGAIAVYACIFELIRQWDVRWIGLGAFNFAVVVATGTRGPIFVSLLFAGLAVLFAKTPSYTPRRKRQLILLGLGLAVVLAAVMGPAIIQRSTGSYTQAGGLQFSGRDIIWALFLREIRAFPLLGQGVGAGKVAVPIEEVELLGSNAAHNEYLRLAVEGGVIGVALLIACTALWVLREAKFFPRGQRPILLAWGAAFAVHSLTGNTLIAPPGVTMFLWLAVIFHRARAEAAEAAQAARAVPRPGALRSSASRRPPAFARPA
jgi:hypothetical protein